MAARTSREGEMASISSWNLAEVKADLLRTNHECTQRGLLHSAKWLSELYDTLNDVEVDIEKVLQEKLHPDFKTEHGKYLRAKSYFDLREYDRAAYFTHGCRSRQAHFLHLYSIYLSGEKKKVDHLPDSVAPSDLIGNESLKSLRAQLQAEHSAGRLDGFGLYLYGVVLKKLDLKRIALDVLLLAVHDMPLHWGSWLELASLVTDRNMLNSLSLPDLWIQQFFRAHVCLELQVNEEAVAIYQQLTAHGFADSTYIMAQVAIALHNVKDVDQSVKSFQKLQKADPCRLDNMDTYSNLLYVKEMRVELGYLAHKVFDTDKYRVETCCVIGNFYSLRSQHEKAVLYFQRALKLNPNYLSAWTLMGHEYMEMKNTSAAIQAYRQAIEVNRRDYRAWYGLGQTYEILKMSYYCLYYYRQAQQLRPNDSRMLVALGVAYEKLDKLEEAKKCFWKAHSVGDIEGMALMKLGKLHGAMGAEDQAVAVFTECIRNSEAQIADHEELSQAYKYLAEYYLKREMLDQAYTNALKCTEYVETREAGNALLRQIAQLRTRQDDSSLMQTTD